MQTRPQTEHGIACLAWASAPLKGSSDARLTHDMWNRFTRHCPWQDNGGVEQANTPAATKGASDNKAPALKQRDFEVMDILCIADTAGTALRFSAYSCVAITDIADSESLLESE